MGQQKVNKAAPAHPRVTSRQVVYDAERVILA